MMMQKLMLLLIALLLEIGSFPADADHPHSHNKPQTAQSRQAQKLKRWKQITSIISMQKTLQKYPYLQQNTKIEKLLKFIDKGACTDIYYGRLDGRYAIIDQEVYTFGGDFNRIADYAIFLKDVMFKWKRDREIKEKNGEEGQRMPDMYVVINPADTLVPGIFHPDVFQSCKQIPMFIFNKNVSCQYADTKFLLPDSYITSSFRLERQLVPGIYNQSQNWPWQKKIPKLFFKGDPSTAYFYTVQITQETPQQDIFRYAHRGGFVILGLKYPDLVQAAFVHQNNVTKWIQHHYGNTEYNKSIMAKWQPFYSMMKYRYLLTADGKGTAWLRNEGIMFSNCVMFKPISELVQWFYGSLVPSQNFILLNDDLSDIFNKRLELENNPDKAINITKEANKVAEAMFVPEAVMKFTGQQLIKYAKMQKLKYTPEEKLLIKQGTDAQLVLKQRVLRQQWEKNIELVTFDKIINKFPFLKENSKSKNILELLNKNKCNLNLVQILIVNDKPYCFGKFCSTQIALKMKKLLNKLSQKFELPDVYFLLQVENNSIILEQDNNCKQIPIFTISKNISRKEEHTRFLLPDPILIDDLKNKLKKFSEKFKQVEWNNRHPAAFVGGSTMKSSTQKMHYHQYYQAKLTKLARKFKDHLTCNLFFDIREEKEQLQLNFELNHKYSIIIPKISTFRGLSYLIAFFTNSVLLTPETDVFYWWDQKIIPGTHFLFFSREIIDLKFSIDYLNENKNFTLKMRSEARQMADKWLTQTAIQEHFLLTLQKYAGLQKLQLSKQDLMNLKNEEQIEIVLDFKAEQQLQLQKQSYGSLNIKDKTYKNNVTETLTEHQEKNTETNGINFILVSVLVLVIILIFGIVFKIFNLPRFFIKQKDNVESISQEKQNKKQHNQPQSNNLIEQIEESKNNGKQRKQNKSKIKNLHNKQSVQLNESKNKQNVSDSKQQQKYTSVNFQQAESATDVLTLEGMSQI